MPRTILGLEQVVSPDTHLAEAKNPHKPARTPGARTRLPLRCAEIAELVAAPTGHVVAAHVPLDELPAARAALPAARLPKDERFLEALVDLALHSGLMRRLVAPGARRRAAGLADLCIRLEFPWAEELGALLVRAVQALRSRIFNDLSLVFRACLVRQVVSNQSKRHSISTTARREAHFVVGVRGEHAQRAFQVIYMTAVQTDGFAGYLLPAYSAVISGDLPVRDQIDWTAKMMMNSRRQGAGIDQSGIRKLSIR